LFKRERTGESTVVDVSLLGAAVWTLSNDLVPTAILGWSRPATSRARTLSSVLVGSFRTADERWISLNMLDPDRHWEPTVRALGLEELLDEPEYGDAAQRQERAPELASNPGRADRFTSAGRVERTTVGAGHDFSSIASHSR